MRYSRLSLQIERAKVLRLRIQERIIKVKLKDNWVIHNPITTMKFSTNTTWPRLHTKTSVTKSLNNLRVVDSDIAICDMRVLGDYVTMNLIDTWVISREVQYATFQSKCKNVFILRKTIVIFFSYPTFFYYIYIFYVENLTILDFLA